MLTKSKETIAKLRTRSDKLQEEIWRLETRTLIKKARCADSRVVEATHVFNEAVFDQSKLVILRQNLLNIQKALVDEHCYNLYQTKLTQKQIENEIDTIVRQIATRTRSADLRQLISALFYFQRISDPFPDDEFDRLVRQWLSLLVNCLYSFPMHENALFLLNHVLRCPSGVNEFLASFVQCQSPLRLLDHQQAIEQVNYCLTFLSTILSPVKLRERFVRPSKIRYVTDATSSQLEKESSDDDLWHLLDGENEKGEDIALNSSDLTEIDIIQLLKQIPFEDVLQFLTSGLPEISNGEDDDCEEEEEEEEGFRFGEYSEIAMLKLLAISTQIIQILRQGLLSFNCMKFKSLSDHITILIKKTILSVCGFWQQCKAKLHSQDQALILRIQVEYDHFILRSVVTILSSQKYGVWKFISVIPFEGITESMMWHILWVFYNGRDEIDELGGLCPYFSDAYWKAKFNEPGTKALFREKLPNLSQSELECLLRSLGNMIKSRKVKEIDFIRTIVEEMFEISCYKPLCSSSLVYRYIQITSELAYLHPFIISIILNGIDSKNEVNEHCIELVIKLPVHLWFPSTETILTLRKWICSNDLTHQLNQLSRIVLSRLNYGSVGGRLNLDVQKHRTIATVVYEALAKHLSVHETLEFSCSFADCTAAFLIKIAKTHSLKMFMEWSWRILLFLKLSPADQPVEPSADFYPLPNLHSDCELLEVSKGFENRNLYSIYICLSMTDIGQNQSLLDFNLEMISHLLLNRIYVPALQLLSWFIPFHLKNSEMILSNVKLQTVLNQMISLEDDTIGHRLLGIIRLQFNRHLDQQEQLLNFWTFLLCEQASIILRQASNAWFIGQLKGLRQIVSLLNNIAIFTFRNEKLFNQLVELLSVKSSEMQSLKLPASGMLGNLLTIAAAPKKCDWITPMHYLYERCSDQTWFAYLLIKSDYLKIEKLWDEIQIELSLHSEYKIDKVTKTVCANYNVTMLPFPLLPVNAWMQLVLETPDEHPLMPLIWYNFFSYFFASPGPGGSLGLRCVIPELLKKGKAKLATMIDHYHRLWSSHISNPMHSDGKENDYIESLLKLYRAYALWIDDTHLHDAYVDVEHLEARYMSEHFKQVLIGNEAPFRAYLDYRLMDQQLQTADKSWQEVIALHQAPFAVQEDDHVAHNSSFLSKFKRLELSCEPVLSAVNNVTSNSSNSSGAKNNGDEDLIESVDFVADLVMPILKNYIRCIIEETDTFDKKLEQLTQLNCQLLADFELLYKNVPNKVTKKVPCDKDGYDPDGCTGPANIQFEFQENVKICNNFKLIEQNRMNYNYIMNEILDIPSSKLISYSIYLERHVPCLPDRLDQSQQLLQYFLSFIDESNVLSFPPASNIFNLLIESLSADDQQNDRNNIFLLHTALTYPKMIEHLTTRLSPSTCSAAYFIQMYQMIQEHLYQTPPHVLFVLLSKFDMNARLRICSESDCLVFLNTLSNAFHGLGQKPDEDKLILIGLYRKHLQYFVIHRFPDYLISVMEMMLKGMSSSTIYPPLWNDLLLSFGLYLPAKAISTKEIIIEFKKYSLNQPLFTSSEIYDIMRLFHQHFQAQLTTRPNQDLLDFYKEYIRSFFPILCALSFIWINTNSADKSNFDNIWNSCVNVWDLWLFPTSSISLLDVPDFEYVWSLFTSVVEHFVEQFGSLSGRILAYMLSSVADHFSRITVHHAQILAVIEEQLYSLPWQLFSPDCNALHCMVAICQSDKYSFNKLISKMLYTVRWNNWDCSVLAEELSSSMELLARILIRVPVDPLVS